MPERIQRKAIYSIHSIATLLGTSEHALSTAFQSGLLPGRQIGRMWYCTGDSLLKYFRGSDASAPPPEFLSSEATAVSPPHPVPPQPSNPTPSQHSAPRGVARRSKPSTTSRGKKSTQRVKAESVPTEAHAKKRYVADRVKQAREQTATNNEAAELLNQQQVPSLSGTPWTHRSVFNLLRWGQLNPPTGSQD